MSVNVMTFAGNVGGDMETRVTPNNKTIGQFNVAVNSGWGENKKTAWVTCKMFNERADKLAQYIKKGMLITVSGELSVDEWEKDGVKNKRVCCIVNDVQLPSQQQAPQQQPQQQPQQGYQQQPQQGYQQQQPPQQQYALPQNNSFDDDIPF